MDTIDEYIARYQETFSEDEIAAIRRWLRMRMISSALRSEADDFMGTGRIDPFVALWKAYLDDPFCR